jgi:hypothetical protein
MILSSSINVSDGLFLSIVRAARSLALSSCKSSPVPPLFPVSPTRTLLFSSRRLSPVSALSCTVQDRAYGNPSSAK